MNCSYPTSYPASLFGILLFPRFMKPVCQLGFVFDFPVFHLVSPWCHNILILLPNTTPLRYYQSSDSSTSHQRQRSPCFSRLTFLMLRPQPRYAPDPRFILHRNGISEFQTSPRMSKLVANMPPNRVRSSTDHHFASGCSPPCLMATQLPSATWLWFTMARTSTVLVKRLPRRTHPREACPRFRGDKLREDDIYTRILILLKIYVELRLNNTVLGKTQVILIFSYST